jgi:hypothetical protein
MMAKSQFEKMDDAAADAAVELMNKIAKSTQEERKAWREHAEWYECHYRKAGFVRLSKKILLNYFPAHNFRPVKGDSDWQIKMNRSADKAFLIYKDKINSNKTFQKVSLEYAYWLLDHYQLAGYKRLSKKLLEIFFPRGYTFIDVKDDDD